MFDALDHLNGWQLVAVLLPIILIMGVIRKREEVADSIKLEDLNKLQKGWIFLTLLSPGLGASILSLLEGEERDRLLKAGRDLSGSAHRVALPVLDLFFKSDGAKGVPSKDSEEICRYLNLRFRDEPRELLTHYRKAYL